jgi:hypothetical protein
MRPPRRASPFGHRSNKAIELPLRESLRLGHHDISTEHILLGVARETEGDAHRILLDCDVDANTIRIEVIRVLSGRVLRAVVYPSGGAGAGTVAPTERALWRLMTALTLKRSSSSGPAG